MPCCQQILIDNHTTMLDAGGDDFDNVIVDWLIKEHLKPAVSHTDPTLLPVVITCCHGRCAAAEQMYGLYTLLAWILVAAHIMFPQPLLILMLLLLLMLRNHRLRREHILA